MSAPDEAGRLELGRRVREALGRATLARARNQPEEALKLVQEAINLYEGDSEAHELKGDILLELKRGEEAIASFWRARELHPDRLMLEDKIARAALQKAARENAVARSQAVLEGRARQDLPKKNPGFAALLSLMVPGLGQLYNGEVFKSMLLVLVLLFLCSLTALALLKEMQAASWGIGAVSRGETMGSGGVFSDLLSGSTLALIVSLVLLWVYAVGDAALRASRTMTSDDTGLV